MSGAEAGVGVFRDLATAASGGPTVYAAADLASGVSRGGMVGDRGHQIRCWDSAFHGSCPCDWIKGSGYTPPREFLRKSAEPIAGNGVNGKTSRKKTGKMKENDYSRSRGLKTDFHSRRIALSIRM